MPPHLDQLAKQVAAEIEAYGVPEPLPQQLGAPLPPEWYQAELAAMKAALVDPYKQEVLDGVSGEDCVRQVVIVAEDDVVLLAFDPHPEGDYVLLFRSVVPHRVSPILGDAVGCFLSR
jgi:hypothetical protein